MEFPDGTILIEILGLYDGWSVAKLPDGTLVNRWDPTSSRYLPTQRWIKKHQELQKGMQLWEMDG